ncbi:hypothetical protein BVY01_00140 [bacterium I07]|nr:hypothetical protein BVY01_00140 [bacterium I07]
MKTLKILLSVLIICIIFNSMCVQNSEDRKQADMTISTDGVPIHFESYGNGELALVFVHGWSCNRTHWDAQIPKFSKLYRMITIDLAGHGESGLTRKIWTIESLGLDVVTVIKELGLKHVILIGHSMGGSVIVEAYQSIPDRVIGLIGVDALAGIGIIYSDEQIERHLSRFQPDFKSHMMNMVRGMFLEDSDSTLVKTVSSGMLEAPPEIAVELLQNYFHWYTNHCRNLVQKVKVPIREIHQKRNINLELIRKYVSEFKAIEMPGVGHFLMMEKPDQFNQLLLESIQEITQLANSS